MRRLLEVWAVLLVLGGCAQQSSLMLRDDGLPKSLKLEDGTFVAQDKSPFGDMKIKGGNASFTKLKGVAVLSSLQYFTKRYQIVEATYLVSNGTELTFKVNNVAEVQNLNREVFKEWPPGRFQIILFAGGEITVCLQDMGTYDKNSLCGSYKRQ